MIKFVRKSCALPISIVVFILMFLIIPVRAELADWRKEMGTFKIGILGGANPAAAEHRVQGFRKAVEEALQLPVDIFVAQDYASLMDAHSNGRIEYAIYSSSAFALGWKLCKCLRPLVAPKAPDGSLGYYSILLTKSSGPGSLDALKGKTIAYSRRDSLSSFIVPTTAFENIEALSTKSGTVFKEKSSAIAAIESFVSGESDALLGWSSLIGDASTGYSRGTLRHLNGMKNIDASKIRVLWKSNLIPHGPHALRNNIPNEVAEILQEFLTKLSVTAPHIYDSIEPQFGGGFAAVSPKHYDGFIASLANFKQ